MCACQCYAQHCNAREQKQQMEHDEQSKSWGSWSYRGTGITQSHSMLSSAPFKHVHLLALYCAPAPPACCFHMAHTVAAVPLLSAQWAFAGLSALQLASDPACEAEGLCGSAATERDAAAAGHPVQDDDSSAIAQPPPPHGEELALLLSAVVAALQQELHWMVRLGWHSGLHLRLKGATLTASIGSIDIHRLVQGIRVQ